MNRLQVKYIPAGRISINKVSPDVPDSGNTQKSHPKRGGLQD